MDQPNSRVFFLQNLHNSESCTIKEAYKVLIKEYHWYLCSIEDYFCHTDRTVVADIIDDKSCEVLKMEKAKEADREKCPDPRTSTDNLMTGNRALSCLVALPNFESIKGDDRVAVCELFDLLQTAHNAAADVAGHLTTLSRTLDPQQFQFILKHSLCPLVQLQVPAGLCHPGELQFAKSNLSSDELFEQRVVNNILPCPYHPKLETVAQKHPTRALATVIHYQLCKRLFTKFTASQTKIADMFQVECKKILHNHNRPSVQCRQETHQGRQTQNARQQNRHRARKVRGAYPRN